MVFVLKFRELLSIKRNKSFKFKRNSYGLFQKRKTNHFYSVKYDEYLLFLPFASTGITKTFCKWIVVNFQLSYLRMTIIERINKYVSLHFWNKGLCKTCQTLPMRKLHNKTHLFILICSNCDKFGFFENVRTKCGIGQFENIISPHQMESRLIFMHRI